MGLGRNDAAAFERLDKRPPVDFVDHQDSRMAPKVHHPMDHEWRRRAPLLRAVPHRAAQVRKRGRLDALCELAFVRKLGAGILQSLTSQSFSLVHIDWRNSAESPAPT